MTPHYRTKEPPPDLVKAFGQGLASIAYYAGDWGPVFVLCEQDREFKLLRQIRFYRVGGDGKPFRSFPMPEYRIEEYVKNFLYL